MRVGFTLLAALSLMLATAPARAAKDDLSLQIIIVTGESSRDSNSTTKTLTVSGAQLEFKETYQGAGAGRRKPVTKQFTLTSQDRSDLMALLTSKELSTNSSVSKPPLKDTNRYFQISINSTAAGQEHSVSIEATPTSDLQADRVYQAGVRLIERIYSIINRTEPDLRMPTLLASN